MRRTLGGDRLGSGKKMSVDMKSYDRSTHDLSYIWRNTQAPGTLTPFINETMLPGDTWDIELEGMAMTHPTVGPQFGTFKWQMDVFEAPYRLYHAWLHNNKVGIGTQMATVKLPQIRLRAYRLNSANDKKLVPDLDNCQINPSSLLAHLDIRGVRQPIESSDDVYQERDFNAGPLLAYAEICKNYYMNQQEGVGAMIWTQAVTPDDTIANITIDGTALSTFVQAAAPVVVTYGGSFAPENFYWVTDAGEIPFLQGVYGAVDDGAGTWTATWNWYETGNITVLSYRLRTANEIPGQGIQVVTFPIDSIDKMRESILRYEAAPAPFIVNDAMTVDSPYYKILNWGSDRYTSPYLGTQQGLFLKTYQSDLFNNWLKTEAIEGPDSISDVTKILTVSGSFTIDTLILHKKIFIMLNRIQAAGNTYKDWLDTTYEETAWTHVESPIWHGGLSKEIIFQEVISNSESQGSQGAVPLGTLGGRGIAGEKHLGGKLTIKPKEHAILLGINSITPRLDYSQGTKWDMNLKTMDDFHKPELDEIGFQNLLQGQMAWWSVTNTGGAGWQELSAGKQPAWINYMTNVNKVRGNFAIQDNEMFMVLTRRYQPTTALGIEDMTTYIDPVKYNQIFAQTSLDSMNFWLQISVNMTVRRLMSAKIMPNL